ncbi:hypothetical protein RJT34_06634 [Clitoria ternatea]|uniref:SAM-dependent MTase DRM-type domain-containing protein n=1 Tax=Clitoria ternatea TaxID=43366 RepID=A0AAN9K512_CLITE
MRGRRSMRQGEKVIERERKDKALTGSAGGGGGIGDFERVKRGPCFALKTDTCKNEREKVNEKGYGEGVQSGPVFYEIREGSVKAKDVAFSNSKKRAQICELVDFICAAQLEKEIDSLEPDEYETLLGFPRDHTRGGGISHTERCRALRKAFQVDTVAYHLSVLKSLFRNGINVLSLFSGIGGAEVALHRLGIMLKECGIR